MGQFAGEQEFPEFVYQFEVTDVVEGGPDGKDNVPLKQLANRTAWLRKTAMGVAGFTFANRSEGAVKNLTVQDLAFKQVVINSNNESYELVLPSLTNSEAGLSAKFMAYNVTKQVTISSAAADIVSANAVNGNFKQRIYLGNLESFELLWTGTHWMLVRWSGNFFDVGSPDYGYSVKPNTVVANGQLLLRADYPRLWEYVSGLGGVLVSDLTWNSNEGRNRGFFSSGTSAQNFRVPDLRGMFLRGLDLGRGVSNGRNSENPGGYEADDFKSHQHFTVVDQSLDTNSFPNEAGRSVSANRAVVRQYRKNGGSGGESYILAGSGAENQQPTISPSSSSGGLETRPKNIGLIPLIKV